MRTAEPASGGPGPRHDGQPGVDGGWPGEQVLEGGAERWHGWLRWVDRCSTSNMGVRGHATGGRRRARSGSSASRSSGTEQGPEGVDLDHASSTPQQAE